MDMSRLRMAASMFLLLSLFPAGLAAADGTRTNLKWQEGEILSRRTIGPGPHNPRTRYIYRIKSGVMQYVARFNQPLSLAPYAPLKFSVARRHLWVQDADGSEQKAAIIKRSESGIRQ